LLFGNERAGSAGDVQTIRGSPRFNDPDFVSVISESEKHLAVIKPCENVRLNPKNMMHLLVVAALDFGQDECGAFVVLTLQEVSEAETRLAVGIRPRVS
jgi:hypothetical protein